MFRSVRVFQLHDEGPEELQPGHGAIPQATAHLICRNLPEFFGAELIAEKIKIDDERTLTCGLHDGRFPIVLEIKTSRSENVVQSGYGKLNWLFDTPGIVRHLIARDPCFGKHISEQIRFDRTELVCIAASFTDEEINRAADLRRADEPVRLVRCLRAGDSYLVFEPVRACGRGQSLAERDLQCAGLPNRPDQQTKLTSENLVSTLREVIQQEVANLRDENHRVINEHAEQLKQLIHQLSPPASGNTEALESIYGMLGPGNSDVPRSTRFLLALCEVAKRKHDIDIKEHPGKTTLRIPYDKVGRGIELVYGVRMHDSRVECYIPRNAATCRILRDLVARRDLLDVETFPLVWIEEAHAVRIVHWVADTGWDHPEADWLQVFDKMIEAFDELFELIDNVLY